MLSIRTIWVFRRLLEQGIAYFIDWIRTSRKNLDMLFESVNEESSIKRVFKINDL